MNKIFLKRLLILIIIYVIGYLIQFILTDGRPSAPDASNYRHAAYTFKLVIFPICLMLGVFYSFSSLVTRWIRLTLVSLVLGGVGPLLLHIAIQHAEGIATMAYVATVLVYCIAASFVFIIGSIAACVLRVWKRVNPQCNRMRSIK